MTRISVLNGTAKIALCASVFCGSSALYAQEVAPVAPPPVVAPAPAAAPITPPPAVPTINDTVAPAAQAQLDAEAAAQRQAAANARSKAAAKPAAKPVAKAAPAAPITAAPIETINAPSDVADTAPIAPIGDVATTPIDPVATAPIENNTSAAPAPVPANDEWLILVGIAGALGLAGAGAVFASRRRRNVAEPVVTYEEFASTPVNKGYFTNAPVAAAPVAASNADAFVDPAYTRDDVAQNTDIAAEQQSYSMATPERTVINDKKPTEAGYYVAHVDDGPTPENPFLTRKKRLVRARFLDRQAETARQNSSTDWNSSASWGSKPAREDDAKIAAHDYEYAQ